jgi:DNA-binding transcriptional MerR regulator
MMSGEEPIYGEQAEAVYTLAVLAELGGVTPEMVLHYLDRGFLVVRGRTEVMVVGASWDDEALRQLRRIEHLRTTYAVNEAGLRYVLGLLRELDEVRSARRQDR